jgi:hypothetical protein
MPRISLYLAQFYCIRRWGFRRQTPTVVLPSPTARPDAHFNVIKKATAEANPCESFKKP